MKRVLAALALVVALLSGAEMLDAQTTTTTTTLAANSATLVWTITGSISDLPNTTSSLPFSCTTTLAAPYCDVKVGNVNISFAAPDSTHLALTFNATQVCGSTVPTCNPLDAANDTNTKSVTATLSSCVYTSSSSLRAYFPCSICFGGEKPSFKVQWTATSSAAC